MSKIVRYIIYKDKPIVFILFVLVALLLYYNTFGAGFVNDMVDWCSNYELSGSSNFFHPSFDYAVRPVYHFLLFSFWKFFSTDVFYWSVIYTVFHAINSFLLYIFLKILFNRFIYKKDIPNLLAFISSFLFLVSPLNTEVVVWLACIHYLLTTFCLLSILILFERYFNKNNKVLLVAILFLYSIAAYSIELAYSIPIILCLYFIVVFRDLRCTTLFFKIIFLPITIITASVLIFTKYYYGSFIGHYKINNQSFDFSGIISRFFIQFLEFSNITSLISYQKKDIIYQFFNNPFVVAIFFLLLLSLVVYATYYYIKYKKWNIYLLFFSLTFIVYLPISLQYFWYLTPIIGDRFHYMIGLFMYPLLVYILYQLLHKYIFESFTVIFFITSIYLLSLNIKYWNIASKVHENIINNFEWKNAKRVFIISQANMYNGAYIMGAEDDMKRSIALKYSIHNIEFYPISFYNMNFTSDKITVNPTSDTSLSCSLNQWGNWFWKDMSHGAVDIKNNIFEMKVDRSLGRRIDIVFYHHQEGDVYLYQDGLEMKEFKFN